ncbi:MAG: transglutaminase domain-containing protein [Alphaproteobacteria bacterium]
MKKIIFVLLGMFLSFPVWAVNYNTLDARARRLSVPNTLSKEQLVTALTNGLTDAADKARVLAAWMVYQIDRNGYERQKLIEASNKTTPADPPLPNDIFKTRIGTPDEYAELFAELATLAGLEVVKIEGYAGRNVPASRYEHKTMKALEPVINRIRGGNYRLQRYAAAWNAVKINGTWQLLDTYWMTKGERMVGQDKSAYAMRSFLAKRAKNTPSVSSLAKGKSIDNDFFFAKPQDFVKTHFPDNPDWQLLSVPRTWSDFTD